MKVSVYNEKGGTQAVLVEPSPGRGLPPVMVQGLNHQDLRSAVLAEVTRLRHPKWPAQGTLGLE